MIEKINKLEQTLEFTARMLCTKSIIDAPSGYIHWTFHNKFHRDHDKPAIVYTNRDKCWYQYGKLHRDYDKPAMIYANGEKRWYQSGKRVK